MSHRSSPEEGGIEHTNSVASLSRTASPGGRLVAPASFQTVPSFVARITTGEMPLPTLDERISIAQIDPSFFQPIEAESSKVPGSLDIPMMSCSTSSSPKIIRNMSPLTSQATISDLLKDSLFDLKLPRCKILSLNDNQKGSFRSTLIKVGNTVTISTFGMLLNRDGSISQNTVTPKKLTAYGRSAAVTAMDCLGWALLEDIHCFIAKKFFREMASDSPTTAPLTSAPADSVKFGGGLAGRRATKGRYCIRANSVCDVAEEDWKKKGANSVEFSNNGAVTVVRFLRIEQRDAACDSFILWVDLLGTVGKSREIGLSRVGNSTVAVENYKEELETVPDFDPVVFADNC